MAATERIPVLMSFEEKKDVMDRAKKAGMKTSQFMRLAAQSYQPDDDEKALEAMIDQMNQCTESATKSIDNALAFIAESNQRILKLEDEARSR